MTNADDGRKRKLLWVLGPYLLLFAFFFGFRAAKEKNIASRQETSVGALGDCNPRGRGHELYCDYTFPVDDERYSAVSHAGSETQMGQPVVVYYDSQNPHVSALEDFSEQSRKNMDLTCIFLVPLAAIFAFLVWNRTSHREPSDEGTP